jgi:hypothetical protein
VIVIVVVDLELRSAFQRFRRTRQRKPNRIGAGLRQSPPLPRSRKKANLQEIRFNNVFERA